MSDTDNPALVCPESTIESANRRNFVKTAALGAIAVGIGSTLLAKAPVLPESAATSSCVCTACCFLAAHNVVADEFETNNGTGPNPGFLFARTVYGEGISSARVSCPPSPNLNGLDFYTGYIKRMSITNGGNVGIGTCSPTNALCVVGSSGVSDSLYVDTSRSNNGSCWSPGLNFGGGGGEGLSSARACGSPNQYGLDFYTSKAKRMSITNAGQVGIGTENPSSALSVINCCLDAVSGNSRYGTGVVGISCTGIGVKGESCTDGCSPGVCGFSFNGPGVAGRSLGSPGVLGSSYLIGVKGLALCRAAVPIVAQAAPCQTANLIQFEKSCTTALTVVNKCGWLGIGASSVPTTLTVGGSLSAKTVTATSNYKMGSSDFAVLASGTITVTLPKASTANGMIVFIKNISTAAVTVKAFKSASETDTIESAATKKLTKQYDSLQLISNGTNEWFVLGNSIGSAFTS